MSRPRFACAYRLRPDDVAVAGALLAVAGDRRSCWQLAEDAGHSTPRRLQALLAEYRWDWTAALGALQRFITARLGDPGAILAVDETADLKKGTATVGVARQHAGITGQVENCQTVVFTAYVTVRAHARFDFRLYLPKSWCEDKDRRQRARVPGDVTFTTKPALGTSMVTQAAGAGVPFAWVAADEVYGRSSRFREACEENKKGYVLAVPVNFTVTLPSARRAATVASLARLVPATAWETRSCGHGCKGHRDYEWAWAATFSPRHWVLIRRSLADPSDQAFFYSHAPEGRPVSLPVLRQTGLDQHQVRLWCSFHRHTVLSMCAQALLATAAARPARPAPTRPPPAAPPPSPRPGATPGSSRSAPQTPHPATTRDGQGQRSRSPPPSPPGHRAHDRCRPRPRPRLVTMAPTPPGSRPMASLPRPAQSRPRHITRIGRREVPCNKPGL